jgi:hypothetical protein
LTTINRYSLILTLVTVINCDAVSFVPFDKRLRIGKNAASNSYPSTILIAELFKPH